VRSAHFHRTPLAPRRRAGWLAGCNPPIIARATSTTQRCRLKRTQTHPGIRNKRRDRQTPDKCAGRYGRAFSLGGMSGSSPPIARDRPTIRSVEAADIDVVRRRAAQRNDRLCRAAIFNRGRTEYCSQDLRRSAWGQGLPVRGSNQSINTRCGSRRVRGSPWRCAAFAAKSAVYSSVCLFSRGSAIHSRMIVRRVSCLFISALLRLWNSRTARGGSAPKSALQGHQKQLLRAQGTTA
jgi:hypothetical protein